MPPVLSANIPITLANKVAGYVEVSLLPNQPIQYMSPLLIDETLPSSSDQESSIQLLEQSEYRYQINVEGVSPQRWCTDRPEIFQPDTVNGRTGRVRTGSYTGWLPVTIFRDDNAAGNMSLEVRSRNQGSVRLGSVGKLLPSLTSLIVLKQRLLSTRHQIVL